MISCKACGTENPPQYKYCLGCGADLLASSLSSQAQRAESDTSTSGDASGSPLGPYADPGGDTGARKRHSTADHSRAADVIRDPAASAAPAAPAPRNTRAMVEEPPPLPPDELLDDEQAAVEAETRRNCPRCGTLNPVTFKFCGACGLNLEGEGTGAGYQAVQGQIPTDPHKRTTDPEGPGLAKFTLVLPDGSAGGEVRVPGPKALLGRGSGKLFDNDPYLSPNHVRLEQDGDGLLVEDAGSLNGVYLRIKEQRLQDGDVFRVGQELLRYNVIGGPRKDEQETEVAGSPNPGFWGRLSLVVGKKRDGSAFPLFGDETVMGRERGDILFYDDGYVSGIHARIVREVGGEVLLMDLDSSNGTYLKLRQTTRIPYGSMLVLGQQLFRIETP